MTDVSGNSAGRQHRRSELGVAFECRVCGRPIVLVADSGLVVVPSRLLFLRMHQACLDVAKSTEVAEP